MKKTIFTLALVAVTISSSASAEMTLVGKPTGKWAIYGETDAMTDKKECIAYYGGNKFIQLTNNSLAVGYSGRGGLEGYTLRFDDDQPLSMKLPERIEKRVGAFIINNSDERFTRLLAAKRLRIQAITLVSGLVDDDVDLTDIKAVQARLQGPECS